MHKQSMTAVFPRDAFNYARLWKSLGFVMLAAHERVVNVGCGSEYSCRAKVPESFTLIEEFENGAAFDIYQDPDTAYLSIEGISFSCGGHTIRLESIYNCRNQFPLVCTSVDGNDINPIVVLEPGQPHNSASSTPGVQFTSDFYKLLVMLHDNAFGGGDTSHLSEHM